MKIVEPGMPQAKKTKSLPRWRKIMGGLLGIVGLVLVCLAYAYSEYWFHFAGGAMVLLVGSAVCFGDDARAIGERPNVLWSKGNKD